MKQALLIIAAQDVMPWDFINRTHLDPFIPITKLWEQLKSYKYEHFPTQIREVLRNWPFCSLRMSDHETEKPHATNRFGIRGQAFRGETIQSRCFPNQIKLLDMKHSNLNVKMAMRERNYTFWAAPEWSVTLLILEEGRMEQWKKGRNGGTKSS